MYKIAEMFYSLQGEGHWTGTPMLFVRMSQCPVGGPKGICKTFDGREFVCDTGASYVSVKRQEWHPYTEVNHEFGPQVIYDQCKTYGSRHICLTGGEPLIYDLKPLWSHTDSYDYKLHIETSGTVYKYIPSHVWLTVSPKDKCTMGMLKRADEVKLLVDRDTKDETVKQFMFEQLYLQPIEEQGDGLVRNTERAIELCLKHGCKLSLQTHKHLGLR